jgi:hypothetical protein
MIIAMIILTTIFVSCGKNPADSSNKAPILLNLNNQNVRAGSSRSVDMYAVDRDGDSLVFSITKNPGFLSISEFSHSGDTTRASLKIRPSENSTGIFSGTIEVNDGKGGTDRQDFTVEVRTYFILADIVDSWTCVAHDATFNTYFTIHINVDSSGTVTGDGVYSKWSVDSNGKVTGSGSYSFTSGSQLIVSSASWSLQIENDDYFMNGIFDVSYHSLHNLIANLHRYRN